MILLEKSPLKRSINCACPICACKMQITLSSTTPSPINGAGVRVLSCPECHHKIYFDIGAFNPEVPLNPVGPQPADPSQP